jgi:hypothetical protein
MSPEIPKNVIPETLNVFDIISPLGRGREEHLLPIAADAIPIAIPAIANNTIINSVILRTITSPGVQHHILVGFVCSSPVYGCDMFVRNVAAPNLSNKRQLPIFCPTFHVDRANSF